LEETQTFTAMVWQIADEEKNMDEFEAKVDALDPIESTHPGACDAHHRQSTSQRNGMLHPNGACAITCDIL
jgi:hypothetical protein